MLAACVWLIVVGECMAPTLRSGDQVLACPQDTIRRGDIIAFWASGVLQGSGVRIKRVIGVPGDSLGADYGLPLPVGCSQVTIPAGSYYVRADRGWYGSEVFGLVRWEQVVGVIRQSKGAFVWRSPSMRM